MRNRDYNTGKCIQIIFQNRNCLDIHIIRRLIKNQYICPADQHGQQIQPSLFSTGEFGNRSVLHIRREQEPLQHLRRTDSAVSCLHILSYLFHIIDHSLITVFDWQLFLCQVSDLDRLSYFHMTFIRLFKSCHNL